MLIEHIALTPIMIYKSRRHTQTARCWRCDLDPLSFKPVPQCHVIKAALIKAAFLLILGFLKLLTLEQAYGRLRAIRDIDLLQVPRA